MEKWRDMQSRRSQLDRPFEHRIDSASLPKRRLNIALLGPCGSGKSCLVAALTGQEVPNRPSLARVTSEWSPCAMEDGSITWWDSPGIIGADNTPNAYLSHLKLVEERCKVSFDRVLVVIRPSQRLSWKHLEETVKLLLEKNYATTVVSTDIYGMDEEEFAAWQAGQRHLFDDLGEFSSISRNMAVCHSEQYGPVFFAFVNSKKKHNFEIVGITDLTCCILGTKCDGEL